MEIPELSSISFLEQFLNILRRVQRSGNCMTALLSLACVSPARKTNEVCREICRQAVCG